MDNRAAVLGVWMLNHKVMVVVVVIVVHIYPSVTGERQTLTN